MPYFSLSNTLCTSSSMVCSRSIRVPSLSKHWQSIRTGNPIESTFGIIRRSTKRSKGCLNRDEMLHTMFKLGQCAEKGWRRLQGFDYLAKVIEGVQFKDGIEVIPETRIAA